MKFGKTDNFDQFFVFRRMYILLLQIAQPHYQRLLPLNRAPPARMI